MSEDLFLDWTRKQTQGAAWGDGTVVTAVPFWGDEPKAYDSMFIASQLVPGLVRVTGKGYEQKIDRKTIPGHKGEKLTQIGQGPAEIDIDVALWTAKHLRDMQGIVNIIQKALTDPDPDPNDVPGYKKHTKKGPPPLEVYHPMLAFFNVTKLTFLRMSLPEDGDGDGVWHIKLTAIQYVPAAAPVQVLATQKLAIVTIPPKGSEGAVADQANAQAKAAAQPSNAEIKP